MSTPSWETVRAEFAWDGSWRDIYVRDVDLPTWRTAVEALIRAGWRGEFTLDGVARELPNALGEVFREDRAAAARWSVRVAGATLNCHFFDPAEIEFDLDPREVAGQEQLDGLVAFMRTLASATHKTARMTPENMPEVPFLEVAPSGATEYVSSGGFFEDAWEPQ